MPGDPAAVRFLFDYLSPYAYLAWTQIGAIAARHGREVAPVPVLLAGLLNAHGQKGPAEIPAKRAYLFKNVVRLADRFGVTIAPPPAHPFNPLLALRVSSIEMARTEQRALVDRLFRAVWATGEGVEDPSVVARLADEIGLDGRALVAAATAQEPKDRLRRQTDDALAAGAFGVPTMFIERELFWGCDALPDVDRYLAGQDPVTPELVAAWETLPATARRTPR